ncbi:hypothetical protein BGZ80_005729 [Entomortierella chlamydospora]|uniref:FAD-binding domain-containing protein n=1 Tax=Entomortierella chlamydospora TaxID=101097 RepID=A0A9P6SU71_9FUNG|nr:hypothetical protein BGZ80_005729 [Entomortierella chlamydospora]
MLGAVLESANISYHILERAQEPRPLGSAIAISANILPVFEQLGIYEELKSISLPHISLDMYNTNLDNFCSLDGECHRAVTGYEHQIVARPRLYDLLHRKVPEYKISRGKKVIRTKERDDGVTVHCSDGTEYECSILVGADGAYSVVRQNMYKKLDEEGNLPPSDKEDFTIAYINMVGISSPPNPEKYPQLSDTDRTHFRIVIGDSNESCLFVTAPDNQICWGIQIQLSADEATQHQFKNSEWGPESIDTMMKDFEEFPCAFGGTMKEIFDATPKHLISKVFLEEKLFQTWYHGRSVLLGDGAVTAMKDAVVLANCLYNMNDTSEKSIETAFANYYRQRYSDAEYMAKSSAIITNVMYGHRWTDRLLRKVISSYLPNWVKTKGGVVRYSNRPQINWLPLVENPDQGYVLPQEGRELVEKGALAI